MTLGLMQPYLFPYLGYFELINRVDRWIAFDIPQYVRHSWMNRNRILHPSGKGWMYITAPVQQHDQHAPMTQILLSQEGNWQQKMVRQLMHYSKAPFYGPVRDLVANAVEANDGTLVGLNMLGLELFCKYLGIPFTGERFSQMQLDIKGEVSPDEWGLSVAVALGANRYVNAPGGEAFFDQDKYAAAGVDLVFQPLVDFRYRTGRFEFEPSLSIIDVCMWNSPESIKAFLDDYSYGVQAA
jgi:hypothetical protein